MCICRKYSLHLTRYYSENFFMSCDMAHSLFVLLAYQLFRWLFPNCLLVFNMFVVYSHWWTCLLYSGWLLCWLFHTLWRLQNSMLKQPVCMLSCFCTVHVMTYNMFGIPIADYWSILITYSEQTKDVKLTTVWERNVIIHKRTMTSEEER